MPDFEAMRQAMNNALETINNEFCNNCKNDYIQGTGYFTTINTNEKTYLIWYCDDCPTYHS